MCCVSIIQRIKDSFGWPGEITKKSSLCAWIGELPKFLSRVDETDINMLASSSTSIPLVANEEEMKSLEDIASYQVLSPCLIPPIFLKFVETICLLQSYL